MTKITTEEGPKDVLNKVVSGKVEKPTGSDEQPFKRIGKKRKYAMLMAYQGKKYFGMQIQSSTTMPTIESKVLDAMNEVGMITEDQRKRPGTFLFQRAARTDRRVSAVRQMVSFELRLLEETVEKGPELLNAQLPSDIRILALRRAIPSFHAQKKCDYRTYSYTIPTFAFAPVSELTTPSYRLSEERRDEVNDLLKCFVGTHNFFNYTSQREHWDASSVRYIISFECSKPFSYTHDFGFKTTEFEFATIYIKGQSFMLHQIRKMIGMTLTILRGFQNKSDITRSFESTRMDVPRAPGLGLILEQVHYHNYDKNHSKTHQTLDTFGPQLEEDIKKIREELIIKEILETEVLTNQMMIWLSDLVKHDFQMNPEEETTEQHGISKARGTALNSLEEQGKKPNAGEEDEELPEEGNDDDSVAKKEDAESEETKRAVAS
ncbi:hypothetical protein FO519_000903 [Halicephalobus sp. NKZ332]|nr:hypothetical protein FO519_000903 [Halicephalobus sp. NKZ332]